MKRWIIAGTAVVLGIGLAGCAPEPNPPVEVTPWPPQTPYTAPPQLSDEEALAIGVATYQGYFDAVLKTYDQGSDDGTLRSLVTSGWQSDANDVIERAASQDWTVQGEIVLRNPELINTTGTEANATIIFQVCIDTSNMTLFQEDGTSTYTDGTPTVSAVEVEVNDTEGSFKVDGAEAIEMGSRCD